VTAKRTGVIILLKRKSGAVWQRFFGRGQSPLVPLQPQQGGLFPAGGSVSAFVPLNGNGHGKTFSRKPEASAGTMRASGPRLNRGRRGVYPVVKRGLDVVLGLFLFLVSAPLVLLAMVLVRLTSRGPALYTQTRVGLDGRPFTIYKLRTMIHECENLTGARWAVPGDSRITALGRILRKTHLDELPQLWNVLKGDMSLVGPRPERPEFVPQLEQAIPNYRARLLVRPGMTGLAQLQLPPDTDLASVRRKLAYDIYYVCHAGLLLDLRLLFGTGLKIMGASFNLLGRLLWLPRREVVEAVYASLLPSEAV
jgi:lipopolysaccharide/colanic/teichoic acid biosynthesis glycosyltransferase